MRQRLPTILSGISPALAVAASARLALLPDYYQGKSTIEAPGEAPLELTGLTASFIQVNGIWGAFVLLIPVFITLGGFLVSWRAGHHITFRKVILWVLVALLLLFCIAGVLSIGIYYVPSAAAMLLAAILSQGNKFVKTKSQALIPGL